MRSVITGDRLGLQQALAIQELHTKGTYHFEVLDIDGRIITKWRYRLESRPVRGLCEHGNEHYGSIKDGEFLWKDSVLWS
jgi:hypothetical protein